MRFCCGLRTQKICPTIVRKNEEKDGNQRKNFKDKGQSSQGPRKTQSLKNEWYQL